MKFPSVKTLADSAANTFKRFPFEVLFALTGTIAATVNIELDNINRVGENWCIRVMLMANLGLLLSLAATLYAESKVLPSSKKMLLRGVAVGIAIALLFVIDPGARQADYTRFLLLSLSLHLLVAFVAFISKDSIRGFWQFNKTLFLRFLTAALYSVVLIIGISAAIAAVNYLFDVHFDGDIYQILAAWIIGMFGTMFFLAGVPGNFEALSRDESYPKALKIFTQYVLIPLASIYVLILLAYEVKILLEWNLPKGAVSYLILGYSVFGILALLLVYPIREQEENKWLKTYARSFYFLLIPLLGLFFAAVGVRVFKYGITEPRYFLIVLACWLLFITVYFLFFKKQNIKLIPVSLCIATLLAVYGPQSAFSISEFSQERALIALLKKNNAYQDGKALPVKKVGAVEGNRMVSILDYLVSHHDLESLQPYFNQNLNKISDSLGRQKSEYDNFAISRYELRNKKLEWVKKQLKLEKFSGYRYDVVLDESLSVTHTFNRQNNITPVSGYDYIINVHGGNDTDAIILDGIRFKESSVMNNSYSLRLNNERVTFNTIDIAKKLIAAEKTFDKKNFKVPNEYSQQYMLPPDSLMFSKQTKSFTIKLAIKNFSFNHEKDSVDVTYVDAMYLVKKN